jgi:hypothetical protein
MKKNVRNNIFCFFLGAILFGGITTVLATTILSSTVSYTNNNQTTVEGALDKLYTIRKRFADKYSINSNGVGGVISFVYWNDNLSNTTYTSTQVPTGSGLNGTYAARELLATAYSNWENAPIYIKTTKVNGTVTGHTSCLWYNNREFCIAPNYWVETGNGDENHISTENGVATKNKLQAAMETALGTQADSCSSHPGSAGCDFGDFYCYADPDGCVGCYAAYGTCVVYSDGSSECV